MRKEVEVVKGGTLIIASNKFHHHHPVRLILYRILYYNRQHVHGLCFFLKKTQTFNFYFLVFYICIMFSYKPYYTLSNIGHTVGQHDRRTSYRKPVSKLHVKLLCSARATFQSMLFW